MFIPTNKKEAKRYGEINILVFEFINLMAKFNPAINTLSEESIKFFIEYTINTYDDKINSNYDFIKESIKIMHNKIQNDECYHDNKLLNQFTKLKKRFDETPLPFFLQDKTINKHVDNKWIHIPINIEQRGKTYVARGREICNIRFPENSKYRGYSVPVPIKLIRENENELFFLTTYEYVHQISCWDRKTSSWLKTKISSKELKKEMDQDQSSERTIQKAIDKFKGYCENKILDESVIYNWIDKNGRNRESKIIMLLDKLYDFGAVYILEDETLSKNGTVFIPEKDLVYNFGKEPVCTSAIEIKHIVGELDFKFISKNYYKDIVNNWSNLCMDEIINSHIQDDLDIEEEIDVDNGIEI